MNMQRAQQIVSRLKQTDVKLDEAMDFLHDPAALVRVNAIETIRRFISHDARAVEALAAAAKDPKNSVRLMGTTTVAKIALAALLKSNDGNACRVGETIISLWSDEKRREFLRHLQSGQS